MNSYSSTPIDASSIEIELLDCNSAKKKLLKPQLDKWSFFKVKLSGIYKKTRYPKHSIISLQQRRKIIIIFLLQKDMAK